MAIDPKADRLIKRTTMVATATAAYLLLTADYGPQENALDPIKRAIESAQSSVKNFIFGPKKETWESENHQAISQVQDDQEHNEKKTKASNAK